MTLGLALTIALAGGLGAVLRFFVDHAVQRVIRSPAPLGIFVVNVSAALFTGLTVGLADRVSGDLISEATQAVIVVGFLGGYSTLSSASVDTLQLMRQRRLGWAALSSLGMLAASVLATLVGFSLAASFGA